MFKIGVFAIILDKNKKILLCHRRDHDLWNLPGGKLEKNESPWKGIIREVKEETGFEIKIEKLIGIYHKPKKNELVFSFSCSIIGGNTILNNEADEIIFFDYAKIPKKISQKHKERIDDAFTNSKKVILKSQNTLDFIDMKK